MAQAEDEDTDETMARTQIFLRRDQLRSLDAEARQRGMTRSELIREHLDETAARRVDNHERWREALKRSAGILADDPDFERRMEEIRQDGSAREKWLWGDG